jgi:hypothetical protein
MQPEIAVTGFPRSFVPVDIGLVSLSNKVSERLDLASYLASRCRVFSQSNAATQFIGPLSRLYKVDVSRAANSQLMLSPPEVRPAEVPSAAACRSNFEHQAFARAIEQVEFSLVDRASCLDGNASIQSNNWQICSLDTGVLYDIYYINIDPT